MITFFSSAKAFRGQTAMQQRNAIGSWVRLAPDIEVMLFGRDDGVAEICAEFNLTHVPDVRCNEFGTPLLSDMYSYVQEFGRYPIICYINADIILLPDFLKGVERVAKANAHFVMTGRRTNLDFDDSLDFDGDWRSVVGNAVADRGLQGAAVALDYFLFRRGSIPAMPPFAIGRPAWDNWLIMDTRRRGVDLIDGSGAIAPVHQNHGYGHVQRATGQVWEGPEADRNRRLALADSPTFQPRLHSIYSANRLLTRWGVIPAVNVKYLWWKIYTWSEYRNHYARGLSKYYTVKLRFQAFKRAVKYFFRKLAGWTIGLFPARLKVDRLAAALRIAYHVYRVGGRRGVSDLVALYRKRQRASLGPLADALRSRGYARSASVIWVRWLMISPEDDAIRHRLFRLLVEQRELRAAVVLFSGRIGTSLDIEGFFDPVIDIAQSLTPKRGAEFVDEIAQLDRGALDVRQRWVERLERAGDWSGAHGLVMHLLALRPSDDELHRHMFRLLMRVQNIDAAVAHCSAALSDGVISRRLATKFILSVASDQAVEKAPLVDEIVARGPWSSDFRYALSRELEEAGLFSAAIDQHLYGLQEKDTDTYQAVAFAKRMANAGDHYRARRFMAEVLTRRVGDSALHIQYAEMLESATDHPTAVEQYKLALAVDQSVIDSVIDFAGRLANQRNYVGAASLFKDALEVRPFDGQLHFQYARLLEASTEYQAATTQYKIALVIDPSIIDVAIDFAGRLENQGDRDGAMALIEQALTVRPYDGRLRVRYARLLEARADYPAAVTQYQVALSAEPSVIDSAVNFAGRLANHGEWAEAAILMESALSVRPHDNELRCRLITLMEKQQRLRDALPWMEAIASDSTAVPALRWCLTRLRSNGLDHQAARLLEHALQNNPADPELLAIVVEQSDAHIRGTPTGVQPSAPTSAKVRFRNAIGELGILNYQDLEVSGERHLLRRVLEKRERPVVLDVGAYKGDYALEVLRICPSAQVFAFEINQRTVADLRTALNGHPVRVFDFGLGERSEEVEVFDYAGSDSSQHASLHREIFDEIHKADVAATPASIRRLDDVFEELGITHIDLLKIDVEGHELSVLKGAQAALSRGMIDTIQFEFNEMNVVTRVFVRDFMRMLPEFEFYRLLPDRFLPLQPYHPLESEIFAFQNIVCFRSPRDAHNSAAVSESIDARALNGNDISSPMTDSDVASGPQHPSIKGVTS